MTTKPENLSRRRLEKSRKVSKIKKTANFKSCILNYITAFAVLILLFFGKAPQDRLVKSLYILG
jgi:hypothetical protein